MGDEVWKDAMEKIYKTERNIDFWNVSQSVRHVVIVGHIVVIILF